MQLYKMNKLGLHARVVGEVVEQDALSHSRLHHHNMPVLVHLNGEAGRRLPRICRLLNPGTIKPGLWNTIVLSQHMRGRVDKPAGISALVSAKHYQTLFKVSVMSPTHSASVLTISVVTMPTASLSLPAQNCSFHQLQTYHALVKGHIFIAT